MTLAHLDAAIAHQEASLASLRALREQFAANTSAFIDVKQSLAEYGTGRDALLAGERKGELRLARASRGKLLVDRAELEQWLRSRPVASRKRKAKNPLHVVESTDWDAWDRQQAKQLRALGGGSP